MRTRTALSFLAGGFLLASCARLPSGNQLTREQAAGPLVSSVGIAPGTADTPAESLAFGTTVSVKEHRLLGVVHLSEPAAGARVTARWYLPDERKPLFGSAAVVLVPASTFVRFSVASPADWKPSPLLLRVTVEKEGEVIGSGSTQAFLGMAEKDILAYRGAYEEWSRRDAEKKEVLAPADDQERGLQSIAEELFGAPAILAWRGDVHGDGTEEYFFADTRGQPPLQQSRDPSILTDAQVRQGAILNAKGAALLLMRDENGRKTLRTQGSLIGLPIPPNGSAHLTLFPARLLLTWKKDDGRACSTQFSPRDQGFRRDTGVRCDGEPEASPVPPPCGNPFSCLLQKWRTILSIKWSAAPEGTPENPQ